jgi:antitoxin component YwqK of YwqJK toxin-antitoxin module
VDGGLNGDWTVADSKGNAVFVWQFQNGKRENVSTWFDSRKVKTQEMMFSDGVPNGTATQLVAGQREPSTVMYDKGRVIQPKTNWYEKGKKRSEETLLAPATKRLVSHDWWSSTVVTEPLPESSVVRQGPYTAWHPNGQKWIEANFSDGEASGEFQRWYANGQLESRGYFEGGEPLGEWTCFHANGMKKMQGSYENGVQIGLWSSWDADGRIELRASAADFPIVQPRIEIETASVVEPVKVIPVSTANATRRPVVRSASLRKR